MPNYESFVKAAQAYFTSDPHGKKIEISEFKSLTTDDKLELSTMLNEAGYTHPQYAPTAQ
jgi:hypothetical protein